MRTLFFEDSEFKLSSTGNFVIINGKEGLAERLDQRLKLFRGKYFMDITKGVPYLEDILIKPIDPGLAASILNAEILKEPDVIGIGAVSTDLEGDTRIFKYSATVKSVFGDVEVSL
ncbi:MAG: hypothetical protein KAR40_13910 [Candidatus Sabulitectum sp.]|nr:hypothetical protein [Candidatus Sabulitectum sp.]